VKKRYGVLMLCVIFVSTLLLGIGYATVSTTLSVTGTTQAEPPNAVYIIQTEVTSGTATVNGTSGTVLSSTVTLENSASSQAVIRVTLWNNTEYPYTFNGLSYTTGVDTYDNTAISVSASTAKGTSLAAGERTVMDLTFKYKSGVSTNKVLNSVINISYVPPEEYIPEIAVKGAIGRFGEILNDPTTYNQLTTAMDKTGSGRWSDSYIGNVAGATDADSKAVEDLFTVDGKKLLTLDLKGDGTETHVTAMIKRENIGGTNANEMVIYMTGEEISGSLFRPSTLQVFAAIYVQNEAGEWVQKGELFEGTARSNPYFGGIGSHNSFNTDTWETAKTYYGVASGSSIEDLLAAIPES